MHEFLLYLLGFLSSNDHYAAGNFGFLDVIEALQWIQVNIEDYGGDPSKVTVMGHSSGAALVNLLLVSPLAKGKFLRKSSLFLFLSFLFPQKPGIQYPNDEKWTLKA